MKGRGGDGEHEFTQRGMTFKNDAELEWTIDPSNTNLPLRPRFEPLEVDVLSALDLRVCEMNSLLQIPGRILER